jgi:arylsulfatase A-like enzyme
MAFNLGVIMNEFGRQVLGISLSVLVLCSVAAYAKPNIVLLYIDDWAWYGTPVAMDDGMPNSRMPVLKMPNVEKLAREGMKFRNAYGSPQCSPARVCIQTGQSTPRNGFSVFMNSRGSDDYDTSRAYSKFPVVPCVADMTIDAGATTIPEALGPLGYACAHFGKWHMRGNPADEGYGAHDGDTTNKEGNQRVPGDPKLMFSITKRSIAFMEAQVKAGKPFYVQISHYAMHAGRETLPETRQKYVRHAEVQAHYKQVKKTADTINQTHQDPATWLGMGDDLDGRIGAVLDKIEALDIEDNTYVIMVSDNGYRHDFLPGLKQPLHARKWWVWDGGIRVPMIVKGPGIKAGSVFKANVVNYDFLPTFVDWAGGDPGELPNIDGASLADYMAGKKPGQAFLNRKLYFHYPHYRESMPHSAMISGSSKIMHFYERPDIPMLFDLSDDIGEVKNIAKQYPEKHKQLFDEMMRYFVEVGARLPKTNPDYDPEFYKHHEAYEYRMNWGPFAGQRSLDEDER